MTGLTAEQLKNYKNKGYISPVNALSSPEAKEIRDAITQKLIQSLNKAE